MAVSARTQTFFFVRLSAQHPHTDASQHLSPAHAALDGTEERPAGGRAHAREVRARSAGPGGAERSGAGHLPGVAGAAGRQRSLEAEQTKGQERGGARAERHGAGTAPSPPGGRRSAHTKPARRRGPGRSGAGRAEVSPPVGSRGRTAAGQGTGRGLGASGWHGSDGVPRGGERRLQVRGEERRRA